MNGGRINILNTFKQKFLSQTFSEKMIGKPTVRFKDAGAATTSFVLVDTAAALERSRCFTVGLITETK